jgi:uncharacterized protein (TIGR03437 family)
VGICVRLFCLCFCAVTSLLVAADSTAKSYTIQTIAGSDSAGDNGPALAAVFSQTEGIALDRFGTIYVSDADDNRVRKITPDGLIHAVAGTGVDGFAGDGGPASAALLSHPYGLAVDFAGNLYIADLGNARIRKVSANGTIQTVAGGGLTVPGLNGEPVPALSSQLSQPRNIAFDVDGTLYVSDFGANRVFRVSPGGVLNSLAGTGKPGFAGDGGPAILAQLNAPAGLACDAAGALYIADSTNNRIRKVYRGIASTVLNVTVPTGVALNSSGALYVAAANYFGTIYRATVGIPSARDVAADTLGNVYVTVGQVVGKIAGNGNVSTVAGSGAPRYFGGDNGPALEARLHTPSGIALDEAGNWYVADTANHRIRRIAANGVITTIAGTGVAGSSGDGGPATLAQLNGPRSVAVDFQNNVYIADTGNNRVRRITPAGNMVAVASGLNDPEYVATGPDGSVYITDTGNNRVLKVTAGLVSLVAQMLRPAAVTVDRAFNVFVADATHIFKISSAGMVTTLFDGLNSPRGLALTADGDLLIAQPAAHIILRLSSAGVLTTIAGTGAPGFSGDGGTATAAQLNSPADVVAGLTGTIWIADSGNNRIRALTPTVVAGLTASVTVVHAATLRPGPIAPGEIVTIFGANFQPGGTQLLFDGIAANIFYSDTTQINALAPSDLPPNSNTEMSIQVQGATVAHLPCAVVSTIPGIFTTANGTGQAAANNEDGSLNSAANPAVRDSIVVLYATGEGGDVSAVGLKLGGYPAEILYAGPAPGFAGLMQVNARVPSFAPAGMLPVVLTVGSASSPDGVTIAVH